MVASGTFGYAREMAGVVELSRLGALVPKTVTQAARKGNAPPRTVETASGLLNSIGLDNDGIVVFLADHLPYLASLGPPVVVSIAAKDVTEFAELAAVLAPYSEVAAIELNISCPNVSGGVDFATDPRLCGDVVSAVRQACDHPLLAKLSPNVTDMRVIAAAAAQSGADAVVIMNTCLGLAVDWRRRRPRLGNVFGGLSGPAIKPIALRWVYQVAQAVPIPIVAAGGIGSLDDVMEFLVAGASAVQLGTANFYDPTLSMRVLDKLPQAIEESGVACLQDFIGSLVREPTPKTPPAQPTSSRENSSRENSSRENSSREDSGRAVDAGQLGQ